METPSSRKIYNFDEQFSSVFKIKFFWRKSPSVPFKMEHVKLFLLSLAILFIHIISALTMLVKHIKNTDIVLAEVVEFGASVNALITSFSRGTCLIANRHGLETMLQGLGQHFPTKERDQLAHQLHVYANIIIRRNKIMKALYISAMVGFITKPITISLFNYIFRSQPYEYLFPFIAWYPFDETLLFTYPILYFLQAITCMSAAFFLTVEDLMFATMATYMSMYYHYLSHSFSQMDARVESKGCHKLKKLIEYQCILDGFGNDMNEIFSVTSFISVSLIKFALCLFMFSLLFAKDIISVATFVFAALNIIFTVYLKCCSGSDLHEASSSLVNSIYDHNWYEGTPQYRKMIVVVMVRANRPLVLQASTLNEISMEYFKQLVLDTYQISMFLHNFST